MIFSIIVYAKTFVNNNTNNNVLVLYGSFELTTTITMILPIIAINAYYKRKWNIRYLNIWS